MTVPAKPRLLARVIDWSIAHRPIVLLGTAALSLAGVWAMLRTPVDAIPDLSDVQVIVMTETNCQYSDRSAAVASVAPPWGKYDGSTMLVPMRYSLT